VKTTQKEKPTEAGLTLVEVTLVIALLLSMISILFIGVSAYKKGAHRAKCILNLASVQKAVRSHQNLYALKNGEPLAITDIAGAGKLLETTPGCPDPDGSYTFGTEVPASNNAYATCSLSGSEQHVPVTLSGW